MAILEYVGFWSVLMRRSIVDFNALLSAVMREPDIEYVMSAATATSRLLELRVTSDSMLALTVLIPITCTK